MTSVCPSVTLADCDDNAIENVNRGTYTVDGCLGYTCILKPARNVGDTGYGKYVEFYTSEAFNGSHVALSHHLLSCWS